MLSDDGKPALERKANRVGLCVPAVFEPHYLDSIALVNSDSTIRTPIVEIYGASSPSILGSQRSQVRSVGTDELGSFVSYAHSIGLEFNYVLNASLLDGSEHTPSGRRAIASSIEKLLDLGVRRFSVAVPFLIRFMRTHYPEIEIVASIIAGVQSIREAERFIDLGVSRIVLLQDMNRRFDLIQMIAKLDVDLELLVNSPCLEACPDRNYHANVTSLETTIGLAGAYRKPRNQLATCLLHCRLGRFENPVEILKTPWIRPEDIEIYRDLGATYFKIDGRISSASYNLRRIEAYARGSYEGNLLYLLLENVPFNSNELETSPDHYYHAYVDNAEMNGIVERMPCVRREMSCRDCRYCQKAAQKYVQIDKGWSAKRREEFYSEISKQYDAE